jgi:hypothetical protein
MALPFLPFPVTKLIASTTAVELKVVFTVHIFHPINQRRSRLPARWKENTGTRRSIVMEVTRRNERTPVFTRV